MCVCVGYTLHGVPVCLVRENWEGVWGTLGRGPIPRTVTAQATTASGLSYVYVVGPGGAIRNLSECPGGNADVVLFGAQYLCVCLSEDG